MDVGFDISRATYAVDLTFILHVFLTFYVSLGAVRHLEMNFCWWQSKHIRCYLGTIFQLGFLWKSLVGTLWDCNRHDQEVIFESALLFQIRMLVWVCCSSPSLISVTPFPHFNVNCDTGLKGFWNTTTSATLLSRW